MSALTSANNRRQRDESEVSLDHQQDYRDRLAAPDPGTHHQDYRDGKQDVASPMAGPSIA